jgi:hypothetical protein
MAATTTPSSASTTSTTSTTSTESSSGSGSGNGNGGFQFSSVASPTTSTTSSLMGPVATTFGEGAKAGPRKVKIIEVSDQSYSSSFHYFQLLHIISYGMSISVPKQAHQQQAAAAVVTQRMVAHQVVMMLMKRRLLKEFEVNHSFLPPLLLFSCAPSLAYS